MPFTNYNIVPKLARLNFTPPEHNDRTSYFQQYLIGFKRNTTRLKRSESTETIPDNSDRSYKSRCSSIDDIVEYSMQPEFKIEQQLYDELREQGNSCQNPATDDYDMFNATNNIEPSTSCITTIGSIDLKEQYSSSEIKICIPYNINTNNCNNNNNNSKETTNKINVVGGRIIGERRPLPDSNNPISKACRLRNLSIAGFIALTIFNILATVRLLHTTVCRRNTQSNDDVVNQMHTVLPRAPLIASSCLDYYIPDAGNLNSTQDRLPFQDVNLDVGRFDNKRLYKIFDHALVGEKFTELSLKFVVGVATQSSIERIYTIVDMANYWNGSISLAAFVSGDDEFQILQIYVSYLRKCFRPIRDKVSFHLVFPKTRQPSKTVKLIKGEDFINLDCAKPQDVLTSLLKLRSEETNKWRLKNVYPQNNLRNIARKGCQTKYVFAIDVDIVPSINFTEHIDKFLRNAKCGGLCAYVLPTFEIDYRAKFPSDKSDVIRLRKKGLAVPFHHKIFIYNQFATNFTRWQASVNDEPVETHISHNVTNYELYYEPFYIAEDTAPPYDERFQGYGFTRNSQVYEMFMAGYQFQVISPLFTCHWGITRSRNRPAWRERQNYANHKLFDGFKREVQTRYNKESPPVKLGKKGKPKQGNIKENTENKKSK